jgi:hypothetical protein
LLTTFWLYLNKQAKHLTLPSGNNFDIQWCITCPHSVIGTVHILNSLHPQTKTLRMPHSLVYGGSSAIGSMPIRRREGWSIAYCEAFNILVALKTWGRFHQDKKLR